MAIDPQLLMPGPAVSSTDFESVYNFFYYLYSHHLDFTAPTSFRPPTGPVGMGESDVDSPGSDLEMPTPSKPRRPTVKNATHGLVEGVKRGNINFSMYH